MAMSDSITIVTNETDRKFCAELKKAAKQAGFKTVDVETNIAKVTEFNKLTKKSKTILFIDTRGSDNMVQKCGSLLTHRRRATNDFNVYFVSSSDESYNKLTAVATEQVWEEFQCNVDDITDILQKINRKAMGYLSADYQVLEGFGTMHEAPEDVHIEIKDAKPSEEQSSGAQVISVTSLKPGVGKSGISSSIALMMAERDMGRILLLEGDLQNYSIYQNLDLQSFRHDKSLLDALDITKEFLNTVKKNNGIKRSESEMYKSQLRQCVLSYYANLDILYVDKLSVDDMNRFNPSEFLKLIALLKQDYDYIIIDSNSNLNHTTAAGVYRLSNKIINILTPDGNATKSYLYLRDFIDETTRIDPSFHTEIHNVLNQVIKKSKNKNYNNLVKAMMTKNTNVLKSNDAYRKDALNMLGELNIHHQIYSIGTDNYADATQMATPLVHMEMPKRKKGFMYPEFRDQIDEIIDEIILA